MHPFLTDRIRLLLYLVAWVFVGLFLSALLYVTDPRPVRWIILFVAPLVLIYAFVCLSAWWVCRSQPLSRGRPVRLVTVLSATAATTAVLWVSLAGAWDRVLCGLIQEAAADPAAAPALHARTRDFAIILVAGLMLYLLSIVIHYLLLAFETSRVAERRAYQSEVTAREAEVRALRAQLNPHFLFNSLNSINALVVSSPEAARRMCQGLGDFLRQTLNLGARESVTLKEELRLVENYLAIEKVRFGARLTFERDTEPEAEECLVPPLLLQPLVENAVKHGVADRIEGGLVRIEAVCRNDRLWLSVRNPLDPDSLPRRGEGVGIENVRRRLAALESGAARLDVERSDSAFTVRLQLPAVRRDPRTADEVSGPVPAEDTPEAAVPAATRSETS
jgi:two-component system sensor histidine kinase AlgZ